MLAEGGLHSTRTIRNHGKRVGSGTQVKARERGKLNMAGFTLAI